MELPNLHLQRVPTLDLLSVGRGGDGDGKTSGGEATAAKPSLLMRRSRSSLLPSQKPNIRLLRLNTVTSPTPSGAGKAAPTVPVRTGVAVAGGLASGRPKPPPKIVIPSVNVSTKKATRPTLPSLKVPFDRFGDEEHDSSMTDCVDSDKVVLLHASVPSAPARLASFFPSHAEVKVPDQDSTEKSSQQVAQADPQPTSPAMKRGFAWSVTPVSPTAKAMRFPNEVEPVSPTHGLCIGLAKQTLASPLYGDGSHSPITSFPAAHDSVYLEPVAIDDMNLGQIFPFLYVSAHTFLLSLPALRKHHIGYIVNAGEEVETVPPSMHLDVTQQQGRITRGTLKADQAVMLDQGPPEEIAYLKLAWQHSTHNITLDFEEAFTFLDLARQRYLRQLSQGVKDDTYAAVVHCHQGRSRSVALVTAYVMREMRFRQSYERQYLRQSTPVLPKPPGALPNHPALTGPAFQRRRRSKSLQRPKVRSLLKALKSTSTASTTSRSKSQPTSPDQSDAAATTTSSEAPTNSASPVPSVSLAQRQLFQHAYAFVRRRHPRSNPNISLVAQISAYPLREPAIQFSHLP